MVAYEPALLQWFELVVNCVYEEINYNPQFLSLFEVDALFTQGDSSAIRSFYLDIYVPRSIPV